MQNRTEEKKNKPVGINYRYIIDYLIIPILMIIVLYDPNFIHGYIDYFEAGKELAPINEIFHGKALYKEVYTHFGPLSTYLQGLAMLLFGKNLAVLRGYFYFGTIFLILIGYLISLALCRIRFVSYATAFMLIIATYHPFWATRWGGGRFAFGLLAILCGVVFFKKERNIWAIFAGMCVSTAFLTSFDIGMLSTLSLGAAFCLYAMVNFSKNRRLIFNGTIFFICGAAIVVIPFFVYFASRGVLAPYITTLLVLAKYHGKVWTNEPMNIWGLITTPSQIFTLTGQYVMLIFLYLCSAIYILYRIFKKNIIWRDYGIVCLLAYGAFMLKSKVSTPRLLAGPQFQMALQPAIILFFVLLDGLFKHIVRLNKKMSANNNFVKSIALSIILVISVYYVVFSEKIFYEDFSGWFQYQGTKKDAMPIYMGAIPLSKISLVALQIPRAKGVKIPAEQAEVVEGIVNYIVSKTASDEPVFTFPEHGIFNFLANRPCIGRFNIAGIAWTTPEWREELLGDLKKTHPRYAILSRKLSHLAQAIPRTEEVLPEISEYINANYRCVATFGSMDILKLQER